MASALPPLSTRTAARLMAAHVQATSDVPARAQRRPAGPAMRLAIALVILALAVFGVGR